MRTPATSACTRRATSARAATPPWPEDVGAAGEDPGADSDDEDSDDENSDDEGLPAAPPAREDSDGSSSDSDDEDDSDTEDQMPGRRPVRDEFSGEQINTMMRLLQARDLDGHTVDAAVGGLISSMDTFAKKVALRVPAPLQVAPARGIETWAGKRAHRNTDGTGTRPPTARRNTGVVRGAAPEKGPSTVVQNHARPEHKAEISKFGVWHWPETAGIKSMRAEAVRVYR